MKVIGVNFFETVYIPFLVTCYRSDHSTDFHAWWLKRCGLRQGCAFWGI